MDTTHPLSVSGGSLKECEIHQSFVASIVPVGVVVMDDAIVDCWPRPWCRALGGAFGGVPDLEHVLADGRDTNVGTVEVIAETKGFERCSRLRERERRAFMLRYMSGLGKVDAPFGFAPGTRT